MNPELIFHVQETTAVSDTWHYRDPEAAPNEKRWHVEPAVGGGLHVRAYSDDAEQHDNLLLRRAGTLIVVELPPLADIRLIPELLPVERLIKAHRRMLECGLAESLSPMLVHSATARKIWPIFHGTLGAFPVSGAAHCVGVTIVWSPDLDRYAPGE